MWQSKSFFNFEIIGGIIVISKLDQYGYEGLEIKGITIHNTGRSESAKELFNEMETIDTSSGGCHFLIDENETIEVLPLNYCAYHTGKAKDWGNNFTIAIEICRSQASNDLYMAAQQRAVRKIKSLMKKYNLTKYDIYFHKDFNSKTYCPHKTLDIYQTKKKFIKEVF